MKIAGLILAGGQALRMGELEKGLQILNAKPLVQHVIERIAPQVQGLWLCANSHLDDYRRFGHPVFRDDEAVKGMGPLAGIASFARYIPLAFSHVQIIPCDTPFVPVDLCARLNSAWQSIHASGLVAGGVYPIDQYGCALVSRTQLWLAQQQLSEQNRSLRKWLDHANAAPIAGFDVEDFMNINTLDQLSLAQTLKEFHA